MFIGTHTYGHYEQIYEDLVLDYYNDVNASSSIVDYYVDYYDYDVTPSPVCRCILYLPNTNITLYSKQSNSLCAAEETLGGVMLYKQLNMQRYTDADISAYFQNYKLCFVIVNGEQNKLTTMNYAEIYLPWWSYTRWVNKTEWSIRKPCIPCLCTTENSSYVWTIYQDVESRYKS